MTRKPRKPSIPPSMPSTWDSGADGPANRVNLKPEAATDLDPATGKDTPNPNGVRRFRRETFIDKYASAGKLTQAQAAAASHLYAAWVGLPNRDPIAAISDRVDGRGDDDPLVSTIDKRAEFYRMWRKVPQHLRVYLDHVVLQDRSIRTMNGCSGGDSEARYMQRLCAGLDAIA